uniref:Uncharacterized protein n=1 Tax=Solanum tuberosum TaxID=4113 RepID=M1DVV5_SOLTU
MALSHTSKIKDGEGIYGVSSIFDGNKVKIINLVKRTTIGSNKNDVVSPVAVRNVVGVPAPKMLSSLTKIDDNENDEILLSRTSETSSSSSSSFLLIELNILGAGHRLRSYLQRHRPCCSLQLSSGQEQQIPLCFHKK